MGLFRQSFGLKSSLAAVWRADPLLDIVPEGLSWVQL